MKKLLGYLFFLAILLVAALIFHGYKEQKKAEKEEMEQRKREIAELREQEKQESRMLAKQEKERQNQRLEDRKKRQELVSGKRNAPTLSVPTPLPAGSIQAYTHKAKVDAACREARCNLIKYQESGGSSYIVVQGPDHNTVSAVLDPLVRSGMRDFTEHKEQFKVEMVQGKRIYTAAYTIKW